MFSRRVHYHRSRHAGGAAAHTPPTPRPRRPHRPHPLRASKSSTKHQNTADTQLLPPRPSLRGLPAHSLHIINKKCSPASPHAVCHSLYIVSLGRKLLYVDSYSHSSYLASKKKRYGNHPTEVHLIFFFQIQLT